MSRLEYFSRPLVSFDAQNREHRQWFADFQRDGTWGKCPVRFIITEDAGDLLTLIRRKLIDFYLDHEFNT